MTQLQIDIGNSAAKWRLVNSDGVLARGVCELPVLDGDDALASAMREADAVWVSCVAAESVELRLRSLAERLGQEQLHFARSAARCGNLVNSYADPATMGVDRWLVMLGAHARCDEDFCVVDVGSAMTIDFVAADGLHQGGYIVPGPQLMRQALLGNTAGVRYDSVPEFDLAPGRSTAEAVSHGIALAMAGAIETALARRQPRKPQLMLTGGAGAAVGRLLNVGHGLVEDLLFEGLSIYASKGS